jgi:ElaB/YqjD/DUF883 family membrane-anchored ribosome-binding protein
MHKATRTLDHDTDTLIDDTPVLTAATASLTGEHEADIRQRLAAALDRGKKACGRAKERALAGARITDKAVHTHPYRAIGIAFGVGALIGGLVARRHSSNGD